MKKLTKTFLETKFDALTDTHTYIVYRQYEIEYKDERGSWWETEIEAIENVSMSSSDLKKDYGSNISLENHVLCVADIKNIYNID